MATLSVPIEPIDASTSTPLSVSEAGPSTLSSTSRDGKSKTERRRIVKREEHRIIAACCGAVVTSLTMTPFDVVKTRLQTQNSAESLFIPSSHLPPPSQLTAVPLASATTSRWKGKGKAPATANTLPAYQHARSLAATNLATCCQKTYFTTNLADKQDILCKFDPREAAARSSAAAKSIPISFSSPVTSGGAIALDAAEACVYPTPALAAQHLPQLTVPSSRHFNGFFDAIYKIAKYEGVFALWRGLLPSLIMSAPSQVVYMVGYENLRSSALSNAPLRFTDPITHLPTPTYIATTTFLAGSVSRTAVAGLLAPLELFRTRLQSTGSHVSIANVTHSVRDLVRQEGVTSLWRGLAATLWRDVPFSGIYWAGYEGIRRMLSGGKGMGEIVKGEQAGKTFGVAFASGAGSGMIASFFTHPFDVIKTRRQTESTSQGSRGSLNILKEIARTEGVQGLWRGFAPRVAKVAPACGIMIGAYEIGLRWAGEVEDQ